MQSIALSWLVYRITGSVFLLGLLGFTSQIPTFILSPFTGVLTDKFDRLKIMKLTQLFFMLQALTVTILAMTNVVQVWHLIALSVVFGTITAFDAPARQSLVIDLIDHPEDLGNAIALNSAIFNGARLIGPAIAGVTIAAVGEGICFLLNTLSFAAVLIALSLVKIKKREAKPQKTNFKESFTEGFNYTFKTIPIRMLIILLTVFSLFALSFIVLLPAYAKEIMKGGSETLGYLMSAMGAGALCGALFMASRKTVLGLGRIILINSFLLGVMIILAALSVNLHLSLVILFFGGAAMILLLSSINTMLQTIAEEDKRGRVMSFYAMALMGTTPIGNLISGSVASGIGIAGTLLISGIIAVLAGIWFALRRPAFRKNVRSIYLSKGILPSLPDDLN